MAAWKRQLAALLATTMVLVVLVAGVSLGGCTDGRRPDKKPLKLQAQIEPQSYLTPRNNVQYSNQQTNILAMIQRRGIMYVTGFPNFGFAGWDISSNAEIPRLLFAAGTQIDMFANGRPWTVDAFASGAVGLIGNYAFTSGIAGMTVINISESTRPQIVGYYPEPNYQTGEINQDLAFVYKAIVPHPTKAIMYGFRENDFVYTLSVSGGVQLIRKDAYDSSGPVCCVRNAIAFGGRLFVAFGSHLVWFDLDNTGLLRNPGVFEDLQVQYVAASNRFLYVFHEPTNGQPQGIAYRRGFYVFDANGDMVDFLPANFTPLNFSINPLDTHILANTDGTRIEIYQIRWARPL